MYDNCKAREMMIGRYFIHSQDYPIEEPFYGKDNGLGIRKNNAGNLVKTKNI